MPVQGAIESVGIREVLRLALAHAPAQLTLAGPDGSITELWCTEDGYATAEPATGPEEVLAEALGLRAGTFAVLEAEPPVLDAVAPADALAAAELLAPLWAQVIAVLPDRTASVRLRRRQNAPVDVTATQWRVLAHVGRGRAIGELAPLLRCSERASQRVVAELVSAGLLEVVRAPALLTAPPSGPALAAPAPPAPPPVPTFEVPATPAPPTPATSEWDGDDAAPARAGWAADSSAPAVDDSWSDSPAPALAPSAPGWSWDADASSDAAAADDDLSWAAAPGTSTAGPIEWDPEPELPAGATRPAPAPVAGFIDDPVAPDDEVLGSTDEELVNRALLFKFLSSVRD